MHVYCNILMLTSKEKNVRTPLSFGLATPLKFLQMYIILVCPIIQAKDTKHGKVDVLIEILLRRPDACYAEFCKELEIRNSDLAKLLSETKSEGE